MDIFKPTVQHQEDQVIDYLVVLAEVDIGFKTLGLEDTEVLMLYAPHSVNHLLSNFDRRRIGLGVTS